VAVTTTMRVMISVNREISTVNQPRMGAVSR
jgi:hypothetical protein